ncbi:MAG TPA: hypothetical protein DD670_08390 [Planctomycetaceae bacterium]|nr:hypothetical protein [Planctomycetaceae bacterium]
MMNTTKRRIVAYVSVAAVVVSLDALVLECRARIESRSAGQTRVLRLGLISGEAHPTTIGARTFARLVEEKSGGRLVVELIIGGALGGEVEMQDMVSTGSLEMACFGNALPAVYHAEYNVLQLPFLWDSPEQMLAFAQTSTQRQLNEQYRQQAGVHVLAVNWDQGVRHTLLREEIRGSADFRNVKIRVPQNAVSLQTWRAIGAQPCPIPFPEVYFSLQQGVIDGLECPLYWIHASSFHEQAKHVILTGHVMYFNVVAINDRLFQNLPDDLRRILLDAAKASGDEATRVTNSLEVELRETMERAGVTFTSTDRRHLRELSDSLYQDFEAEHGRQLLDEIEAFKDSHCDP